MGDAKRVAQYVATLVENARCSEGCSEVAEQRRVDPPAFDQIEPRRNAQPARELDAEQNGLAELSA